MHYLRLAYLVVACTLNGLYAAATETALTIHNNVTPALAAVLQATGLLRKHTLEDAIAHTQRLWLRPKYTEREYLRDDDLMHQQRAFFLSHMRNLGLIHARLPQQKKYTHLLIMGTHLYGQMFARMNYARELFAHGLRVNNVAILSGSHDIFRYKKNNGSIAYKTEIGLLVQLIKDMKMQEVLQVDHETLHELSYGRNLSGKKQVPKAKTAFYLCGPRLKQVGQERANTADTLRIWRKTNPQKGSCLVISNQPYVGYQVASARNVIRDEAFHFDGAGPAAEPELPIKVYLDTVARQLFNEYQYRQSMSMRAKL